MHVQQSGYNISIHVLQNSISAIWIKFSFQQRKSKGRLTFMLIPVMSIFCKSLKHCNFWTALFVMHPFSLKKEKDK